MSSIGRERSRFDAEVPTASQIHRTLKDMIRVSNVMKQARVAAASCVFMALGLGACSATGPDRASEPSLPVGGRPFEGSWTTQIDSSRSLKLNVIGAYKLTDDVADAPPGRTDLRIEVGGDVRWRSTSEHGRATQSFDVAVRLLVPSEACPFREPEHPLRYCEITLDEATIGGTDEANPSGDAVLKDGQTLGTVRQADVHDIQEGFSSGVLLVTSKSFGPLARGNGGEVCHEHGVSGVTYFSSDPEVTLCSILDRL